MMSRLLRMIFWGCLFLTGFLLWIFSIYHEPKRSWIALVAGFDFFIPLSSALITWSAIIKASYGSWPREFERISLAAWGCAIPSIVVLAILWIWNADWQPWTAKKLTQGVWFSPAFLFTRDFLSLVIFWFLAGIYFFKRINGVPRKMAAWLIIVYSLVITLLAFDLIMGLVPGWFSTAFGAYTFISALYAASAVWAIIAAVSGLPKGPEEGYDNISQIHPYARLHDIGKIVFAFAILTGYFMFCQLLPIWYENLPVETQFLIPRINFKPWKWVSIILLITIYIGPIGIMLTQASKRTPWILIISCIIIICGLWIERLYLVLPSFSFSSLELSDVGVFLLFVGVYAFCMEMTNWRIPKVFPEANGEK